MASLDRTLRRDLENAVKKARRVAEAGAAKAIDLLAVENHEPWATLTPEQRKLRNRLRAHGRQLGDRLDPQKGTQGVGRLVAECAYEHWHRMLFARFLAENNLLIEPVSGMPLTLAECQELAREQGTDWLPMASSFAERMLPQIFRPDDPVLEVSLPPEARQGLEEILKGLPTEVFLADDSLGWVYQFWQSEKKDEVNKSGVKIGAEELPAVTQLFTEDYMVLFLLHNTLGAWWAGKYLAAHPEVAAAAQSEDELRRACAVGGVEWTYLRFVREGELGPWRPAAGTFDGWQNAAKDITVMDPCMGSGHFLVFALPILVAFRMVEEGLSREDAVYAVLRDNLHGLEIDQRCSQIAAFNLALAAWRTTGYRGLPQLNLACSGLSTGVSKTEWIRLAERAAANSPVPPRRLDLLTTEQNIFSSRIIKGLERLHDLFEQASVLGSLIDPRRGSTDIFGGATFRELQPILERALAAARADEGLIEMAAAARGMAMAAEMLSIQFSLVVTNVPYLSGRKQVATLAADVAAKYPDAKSDLGVAFLQRMQRMTVREGVTAAVSPQGWLFSGSYEALRRHQLAHTSWALAARLGAHAFETISGEVVSVVLLAFQPASPTSMSEFMYLDCSEPTEPASKASQLQAQVPRHVRQESQVLNPGARITGEVQSLLARLEHNVDAPQGIKTGDDARWIRQVVELPVLGNRWEPLQTTVSNVVHYGGRNLLVDWATAGNQMVRPRCDCSALGRPGVAVSQTGNLPATLYGGTRFDSNVAPLVPKDQALLLALWAFCSSPDYHQTVRDFDKSLKVSNVPLTQVRFDIGHWTAIGNSRYPAGLPKPHSDDPTQWLFNGHPRGSENPLQVAVARLLGYRWPRQTGSNFMDCPALGPDGLEKHADDDGIVCLTSLHGEASAADRLRALLADAFGAEWSASKQNELLTGIGCGGQTLDEWLQDSFFEQHCKLFQQRPFVWHVWDGLLGGFGALVNYHKLAGPAGEGRRTLEKLIYTYLGDWIDRQRADQTRGVEGADARVAAAEHLKKELERILEGEPPYDLFVRWKPLHEQAIGWEPDINDGVRLNIRPYMTAKPLSARAKSACILRVPPKSIKWDKDRGKEPTRAREDFPWFWSWDGETQDFMGDKEFDGNRWNDLHYSRAAKAAARARATRTEKTA